MLGLAHSDKDSVIAFHAESTAVPFVHQSYDMYSRKHVDTKQPLTAQRPSAHEECHRYNNLPYRGHIDVIFRIKIRREIKSSFGFRMAHRRGRCVNNFRFHIWFNFAVTMYNESIISFLTSLTCQVNLFWLMRKRFPLSRGQLHALLAFARITHEPSISQTVSSWCGFSRNVVLQIDSGIRRYCPRLSHTGLDCKLSAEMALVRLEFDLQRSKRRFIWKGYTRCNTSALNGMARFF